MTIIERLDAAFKRRGMAGLEPEWRLIQAVEAVIHPSDSKPNEVAMDKFTYTWANNGNV